jgi:hypothetical protein
MALACAAGIPRRAAVSNSWAGVADEPRCPAPDAPFECNFVAMVSQLLACTKMPTLTGLLQRLRIAAT